jgi:hypothetical protein
MKRISQVVTRGELDQSNFKDYCMEVTEELSESNEV